MNQALYQHTDAFAGHKGAVLCAIYCADLDLFATGGDDGTVRLWPQREHHSLRLPRGSALGARCAAVVPQPVVVVAPTVGAFGRSDDEFDDFDFEESMGLGMDEPSREPSGPDLLSGWAEAEQGTHKVLSEHTDRVTGLACEGCHLVSVSWDLSMRVWNLASERGASSHVVDNAHDDYLLSVTFSPEQGQIASSSADQGVKLWDWNADVNASEAEAQGLCIPDGKKARRHTTAILCCPPAPQPSHHSPSRAKPSPTTAGQAAMRHSLGGRRRGRHRQAGARRRRLARQVEQGAPQLKHRHHHHHSHHF